MPPEAVLATLRELWELLQRLQLPGCLMGGLALSYWGHPRFTKDVDALVATGDMEIAELMGHLAAAGFRPKRTEAVLRLADAEFLQVVHEPPDAFVDVQVDLLLVVNEYQRQAIQRRIHVAAADFGFPIDVLACEDLILHKLLAGRLIDLADAAAVLRANRASLDLAYLLHWIAEKELAADFDRIWAEAFPGEPAP